MAGTTTSPTGFSYAQAARGRAATAATPQTPSSKVTSGAATPATGTLSELAPSSSNWADDVESTVVTKSQESSSQEVEQSTTVVAEVKGTLIEQVKSEDKLVNGTSSSSSPDLAASTSSNLKEDDTTSSAANGTSETTWESKSQASEPAWIAERKERQNGSPSSDATAKAEKDSKSVPAPEPPKPTILQESAPPAVNPWLKRAEENKAKQVPKPAAAPTETAVGKENQRAKTESRRRDAATAAAPQEQNASSSSEPKKVGGPASKRSPEGRATGSRQNPKPAPTEATSSAPSTPAHWANVNERQTNASAAPPPSVRDEASWPTPLTAQEKERKDSIEKETAEDKTEDENSHSKRKKPEWKPMAVVPTVIWETPSMNEDKRRPRGAGSERAGRGGARGRGGLRGGLNGIHGGDRNAAVKGTTGTQDAESLSGPRGRTAAADREAMPPPPRPARAASANAYRGNQSESVPDRRASVIPDNKKFDASLAKAFAESRRARSPKKPTQEVREVADDAQDIPKPIPRASSVDNPEEPNAGEPKDAARDAQASKTVSTEGGRKEQRSFDGPRDPTWAPSTRGAKRNGRGRGGNGNGNRGGMDLNGHPNYGNNFSADFTGGSPFGVPPSPNFNGPRGGGAQFQQYNHPGRGGWPRNPRAQSIPTENNFNWGRYNQQQQYAPPGGLAPIQTYVPGMYEYAGAYPATAMPYQPYMDNTWLLEMVSTQLEYYFSIDNLVKDMFLRKHMDSQGFVFLDFIVNFNRIKQLTHDRDFIKTVCLNSQHIEIRVGEDGKERLRRREGWAQFILPMDQREAAAQTDGPKSLQRPERPQVFVPSASSAGYRGPASAGVSPPHQRGDRNASYSMMNGFPAPYGSFGQMQQQENNNNNNGFGEQQPPVNGEESRGRTVKSPVITTRTSTSHHLSVSAAEEQDVEPDAFPDEQANVLTVLVKCSKEPRAPFHSAASRTFSNGSIDSKSIMTETEQSATAGAESTVNGGESSVASPTARGPSPDKKASSTDRSSNNNNNSTAEMEFFWVKDQDVPVENLPSGLTSEPYVSLRFKALDQRDHAATGTCPYDLDVLYQFWCHFLLRNFNNRMYSEFKYYANEDAKERHNLSGLLNLLKFYAQALNSHHPIRERVVKDYVALVKNEPPKLDGQAFRQLRAAWRNGALNLKNRKKLADTLDAGLKGLLDGAEP